MGALLVTLPGSVATAVARASNPQSKFATDDSGALSRANGFPVSTYTTPTGSSQTLGITVQHTGDLVIVSGRIFSNSYTITGMSDTARIINWQSSALQTINDPTGSGSGQESYEWLWYGVASATGSTTVTATFSGSPGRSVELVVDSLTGGTGWGVDKSATLEQTTATQNWQTPTLTPSGLGQAAAYWGYTHPAGAPNAVGVGGTPPGYTYWQTGRLNLVSLNPSVSPGVATQGEGTIENWPNETQPTADTYDSLGAVFYCTAPPAGFPPPPPGELPPTTSGLGPGSGVTPSPPSAAQIKALLAKILAPHGSAANMTALLSHGGYSFSWTTPSAGRLVISWYQVPKGATLSRKVQPVLVAAVTQNFSRSSRVKIKVALTKQGKQLLKSARRIQLTAKGSFAPQGKPAATQLKVFTLSRKDSRWSRRRRL